MLKMILAKPIGKWADGTKKRVPVLRERKYRMGPIEKEQNLRVKEDVMICGAAASGKSRYLSVLREKAKEIWGVKTNIIYFQCRDNLSVLLDSVDGNGQIDKINRLLSRMSESKTILLLDDIHALAGKKLMTINRLVSAANLVVSTTTEETRIPASLRLILLKRNPQQIRLNSDQPFDVTNGLMWFLILVCLGTGNHMLALALGGTKLLAHGNRSTKQSN